MAHPRVMVRVSVSVRWVCRYVSISHNQPFRTIWEPPRPICSHNKIFRTSNQSKSVVIITKLPKSTKKYRKLTQKTNPNKSPNRFYDLGLVRGLGFRVRVRFRIRV